MEGYPVAEAARILDCAVGTVKSRCSRGRARLAELLGVLDPAPTAPTATSAGVTRTTATRRNPAPARPSHHGEEVHPMADGPPAGPADGLTPEQETVRRLLADARHAEPMPDDVVDRLDRVLAGLAAGSPDELEPPPAAAAVVSLASRRRRRAATLLVAAAAVVARSASASAR